MSVIVRFVGLSSLILLACAAHGQEHPEIAGNANWDISIWTAGATGEEDRNSFAEAQIWGVGFAVARVITDEIGKGWWRGRLEYGFSVIPVFVQLKPGGLHGGGFEPVLLRWNSSRHLGRVAPYIELGGGAVVTNSNLPAGDTSSFNFTAKGGGGFYVFTTNRQSLDVGCRWWHISNANLGVRNPEFNGVQISVGYHWFR